MASPKKKSGQKVKGALSRSMAELIADHNMRMWVEAILTNGGDAIKAAVTVGMEAGKKAERFGLKMMGSPAATAILQERRKAVLAKVRETDDLDATKFLAQFMIDIEFDPVKMRGEDRQPDSDMFFRRVLLAKVAGLSKLRFVGIGIPEIKEPEKIALVNLVRTRIFEGCYKEQLALGMATLTWAVPEWPTMAPDLVTASADRDAHAEHGREMGRLV